MPRNKMRNKYITIGLPLDSPLLHKMEEEARRSGTALSKLIPVKLDQLYSGISLGIQRMEEEAPHLPTVNSSEANALAFLESED